MTYGFWLDRDTYVTPEAAQQMAESAVGKPVTLNFDPSQVVGSVLTASVDELGLTVTMDVDDDVFGDTLPMGFRV